MLPALEAQVVGMAERETRQIQISPEDGYGQYNKELILSIDRNSFPPDIDLTVGRTVQSQNRDGERVMHIYRS